ncbi:ribbon-helix-helix protein, CopG family [Bradyrhizobium sp. McL0616]|uniref:ribbon-helix-helix protein, CopG family n=1 Tax=Bradyrhizobium sp. McL0616 TaxID=3415674 RepID=UPI003CEECF1E
MDPVSAVRLPADVTAEVDAWGEARELSRSEAIRRLVEIGLTVKTPARPAAGKPDRKLRAQELATKVIEKIIDPAAPREEQAQRRRRLTKGPTEFRGARLDQPMVKK